MKSRVCHLWLSISLLCIGAISAEAFAQETSVEDARILFEAGAKAYSAGLYADAVSAFREAYALTPDRPTVLFSLAQAERRQFTVSRDPALLEAAIAHFRRYLELVAEGGRRGDAVVALGELEALRASMESRPEVIRKPRVFITTETPAAVITIDGVRRDKVPVIEEVSAGKHVVQVSAPGFFDETREIVTVDGTVFPLEINLREKPSFLFVDAPRGASIAIDGRSYADAPLNAALELAPGPHSISVTQRGHVSFAKQVLLPRGSTLHTRAELAMTTQRRVSYVLFGTAIASFGVGWGLAIGALVKDGQAEDIYERAKKENIDQASLDQYSSALEMRNALAGASFGTFLLGAGVTAAAVSTYWFDSSSQQKNAPVRNDARVSIMPLQGGAFLSLGARF